MGYMESYTNGKLRYAGDASRNNGFNQFLQTIGSFGSSLGSLAGPIGSIAGGVLGTLGNILGYRVMNSHLTGKEREQNAFNAEQAQINRDYQTEMSNTAYQRAVTDMQAAGLNPALMYGNGSAASTPTGSNAQGTASVVSPFDVISMVMQMKLAQAEIGVKKSQERLNDAKAEESGANTGLIEQNTKNAVQEFDKTAAVIRGLNLSNWREEILLEFARERERTEIDTMKLSQDEIRSRMGEIEARIDKMSAEKKAIFQSIVESYSRIRLNNSSANLNDHTAIKVSYECSEVEEKINKLIAETDLTKAEKEMLEKDIKWYCWNHGAEISGVGVKPGMRYFPTSNDEIKNK